MRRILGILAALVLLLGQTQAGEEWSASTQWAKGKRLRVFVGGDPGDTFSAVIYRGAVQAAMDTGAEVEYVFSAWNLEKMMSQFREAIASKPDGIVMLGHSGDKALMPLAKQAVDSGIKLMWVNSDVPELRKSVLSGYVGVIDQERQGMDLAAEAMRRYDLPQGSTIIVLGAWGEPGREMREGGAAKAFEEAGYNVVRIRALPAWNTDVNLGTPVISGAILANPDASAIVFSGGQLMGVAHNYMRAANKKPGEVKVIGFDVSPEVIRGMEMGYIQLTSDQQPFLQGYLPVLSLCQQLIYGLAPLVVDTGNGYVTPDNYKEVAELAAKGLR